MRHLGLDPMRGDMVPDPAPLLRALFDRAIATADPMRVIAAHLPARPSGRVLVIGAGKASARMAEAVESVWGPCEGLVITRYGYGRPTRGIRIVEAAPLWWWISTGRGCCGPLAPIPWHRALPN